MRQPSFAWTLASCIAFLGLASLRCGDAPLPQDVEPASDQAPLSGSYACSPDGLCICQLDPGKSGSDDCDLMASLECCPNPTPDDIFCGDRICDYDSKHRCKCTTKKSPPKPPGPISIDAPSCKGRCGGAYNPSAACQCDSLCRTYGDCCYDYGGQCLKYRKGTGCSCAFDCSLRGNCCLGC